MQTECPKCSNTMNPAAPHASYVNCIGCNTLLSHPPTSLTIQCLTVMDLPARGVSTTLPSLQQAFDASRASSKSRKKRKDPNAPKRATNAYMIFCKERRAALKEERPDLQFGKLGAKLGEMWRTMSAEEKRPYESRATGDRDRYKAEMGSYQSANMLKGNAMSQLGLSPDDGYGGVKKTKLDDGSGLVGMSGGLDYSSLDPAQLEMLQQQQQFMQTFQQQQMVGMQQAAAMQQQQQQQQQAVGADLSGAYAQAAQAQLQASSSAAADTTSTAAGTKSAAGNSSSSKQSEADEGEDDEDGSEEDEE